MTIRRHADLASMNEALSLFEAGCEAAPERTFVRSRTIRDAIIGRTADHLLSTAREHGVATCPCDGIREIEALCLDMIRRADPDGEIESAIGLGRTLRDHPGSADRVISGLRRDRDALEALATCEAA